MRLRNKKTGEIWDIGKVLTCDYPSYETLKQLNEEWEDYEPTEPLIKDEKIRRAVRAWAEANKTNHVWVSVASDGMNITQDEQYPPSTKYKQSITFECEVGFKSNYYTITELCGEEDV